MTNADSLKLEEEEMETITDRGLKRQNSHEFSFNKKWKQKDETSDDENEISVEENEIEFLKQ